MDECEVSILMPCLNEAETLAVCIAKAKHFLLSAQISGEIIIADNGSTDGSQMIATNCGAKVIEVKTRGYGAALKSGIGYARGKYIIMGDADDSYDFLNLYPFLEKLRQGHDLVMGNRFQGGISVGAMPFLNRYIGNPILSYIGRLFFKSKVHDFHCGLRGFNTESIQSLQLEGDGMEFASEMIIKATLNQLSIIEVPTTLVPDGRSRRPHLRPFRDGWRHLRLLLLFSPKWLFFYPGCLLIIFGLLLMTLLFAGPIIFLGINFDIHTMLFSSLFTMVGLQAICFAGFATYIVSKRHPQHARPLWIVRIKLEYALILASMLILLGSFGASYPLYYWVTHAFGPLQPTQMMRILIPAITFIILGVQVLFASFFMNLITLHYKS